MLTAQNINVHDLVPSVLASEYAMRTHPLDKPLDSYTENSALITPNPHIGIGMSTYLIDLGWLASLEEEED